MRANNEYVDVVYKLSPQTTGVSIGVDKISAGSPVVATGEIIDGKMVVEPWVEENYQVFTPPPSGTHIVGRFDPWVVTGFIGTTMWLTNIGGVPGTAPAIDGPTLDPDTGIAYLHAPMLTRGYYTTRATGFNYNEHYFQPGMPSYIGYRGVEEACAADDSWRPTTNSSNSTYISGSPSQPANLVNGAFYFAGPFTT